jgi:hypothetical protein
MKYRNNCCARTSGKHCSAFDCLNGADKVIDDAGDINLLI